MRTHLLNFGDLYNVYILCMTTGYMLSIKKVIKVPYFIIFKRLIELFDLHVEYKTIIFREGGYIRLFIPIVPKVY